MVENMGNEQVTIKRNVPKLFQSPLGDIKD